MKLYEINSELERLLMCVDYETGEISDETFNSINSLIMDREEKILSTAKFLKNIEAEAQAIAFEIKKLSERKKSLDAKHERINCNLLTQINQGESLKDAQVKLSWRSSTSVIVYGDVPKEYCKTIVEPSKTMIKEALNKGIEVPGAELQHKKNLVIT